MANSYKSSPINSLMDIYKISSKTSDPLGYFDQGDPNVGTLSGDIPGPLGSFGRAMPNNINMPGPLGSFDWVITNYINMLSPNHMRVHTEQCRAGDERWEGKIPQTLDGPYKPAIANRIPNIPEPISTSDMKAVSELSLSEQGLTLLKDIEQLRLKPYDDQTAKEITVWTAGATIGYGHLIKKTEWNTYKSGITVTSASILFGQDLSPFINAVRSKIKVKLKQQQFDALVMLAFNIGAGANGFSGSSVVKLVNDPEAKTNYKNLESAWKAWSKSQGKVMKGLENRRACEWNIYSQGIYKKW
jgi:lysozyme